MIDSSKKLKVAPWASSPITNRAVTFKANAIDPRWSKQEKQKYKDLSEATMILLAKYKCKLENDGVQSIYRKGMLDLVEKVLQVVPLSNKVKEALRSKTCTETVKEISDKLEIANTSMKNFLRKSTKAKL